MWKVHANNGNITSGNIALHNFQILEGQIHDLCEAMLPHIKKSYQGNPSFPIGYNILGMADKQAITSITS